MSQKIWKDLESKEGKCGVREKNPICKQKKEGKKICNKMKSMQASEESNSDIAGWAAIRSRDQVYVCLSVRFGSQEAGNLSARIPNFVMLFSIRIESHEGNLSSRSSIPNPCNFFFTSCTQAAVSTSNWTSENSDIGSAAEARVLGFRV